MSREDILMQITEKMIEEELIDTRRFSYIPEMAGYVTALIDESLKDYELVPKSGRIEKK